MWTAIFCALSAAACVLCLTGCVLVVRNAAHVTESQAQRLDSAESRIKSLRSSHDEMAQELEHLANRVKMQRVRNATDHASKKSGDAGEFPDPVTHPNEWRTEMNKRLAIARLGAKR